jgi:hypothetical protein
MDLRTNLAPAIDRTIQLITLDGLHGAIERDPRHDLRMGEMTARTTDLPDAFIRLTPR